MSPELRSLMTPGQFYRAHLLALGRQLPADDAVVAEWLDDAARHHDALQFIFVLYAALVTDRKVNARHLVRGMPLLSFPHDVMCVAFKLEGDVPAAIAESIQFDGIAPGRKLIGMVAAVEWCLAREGKPWPQSFISEARFIARKHWKGEDVPLHFHLLALATGDASLQTVAAEKFSGATPENLAQMAAATAKCREEMRKLADLPILQLLPEAPPAQTRVLASGKTMRRAAARVGRNDPCPCGSGKKYKHCCIGKDDERLHHSTHVAGKTQEELAREPEPHLTPDELQTMHTAQFARLNPLKLKAESLEYYLYAMVVRGLLDEFLALLPQCAQRPEIDRYEAWHVAVWWGTHEGHREFVEKLMQMPDYPERLRQEDAGVLLGLDLLLNDQNPGAMLAILEEKAAKMLDETDDQRQLSFGLWLIRNKRLRSVGALASRGMIALGTEKTASFLLDQIMQLRDRLNLALDDPISELVDKKLLKLRHEHAADDEQEAKALRKAQRNLEKKAAEVRELKETLNRVQRDLELREKREKRAAAETVPPSAEDKKQTAELRDHLEQIKSALKQTHLERNEFRRDLEKAHQELEKLRAAQAETGHEEQADLEETLLLPPDAAISQPVRLLEFPKKFEDTLRGVPRHIARNTMVTLGQIAGGDPAGFVGARRLNVCEDITRQRIGSDYRLLFRLLPERVQVVTLINRRDLDRTIKSLKNTT